MSKKLKTRDINLLSVCQEKKEPSKNGMVAKYIMIPLVAAILFLAIFGFNKFRIYQLHKDTAKTEEKISTLNEKIASDPNLSAYAQYEVNTELIKNLETLTSNMNSYPQLLQNTFDQIVIASDLNIDVTSLSYMRESQAITLSIAGSSATDTENFVRRLKETGVFASVDYSGYSRIEKTVEVASTNDTTQSTTNNSTGSSDDETKKLLEQLLSINKNNTNDTKETTTTYSYTATVVCVLK